MESLHQSNPTQSNANFLRNWKISIRLQEIFCEAFFSALHVQFVFFLSFSIYVLFVSDGSSFFFCHHFDEFLRLQSFLCVFDKPAEEIFHWPDFSSNKWCSGVFLKPNRQRWPSELFKNFRHQASKLRLPLLLQPKIRHFFPAFHHIFIKSWRIFNKCTKFSFGDRPRRSNSLKHKTINFRFVPRVTFFRCCCSSVVSMSSLFFLVFVLSFLFFFFLFLSLSFLFILSCSCDQHDFELNVHRWL